MESMNFSFSLFLFQTQWTERACFSLELTAWPLQRCSFCLCRLSEVFQWSVRCSSVFGHRLFRSPLCDPGVLTSVYKDPAEPGRRADRQRGLRGRKKGAHREERSRTMLIWFFAICTAFWWVSALIVSLNCVVESGILSLVFRWMAFCGKRLCHISRNNPHCGWLV